MGRFDALTKLEEIPKELTPLPVSQSTTTKQSQVQPQRKPGGVIKKPEFMKSRKSESPSPRSSQPNKPEKYSTLIDSNLIRKLKVFAVEKDIKDYQVIEFALSEYFEKHQYFFKEFMKT
jgi:hypothetical protein